MTARLGVSVAALNAGPGRAPPFRPSTGGLPAALTPHLTGRLQVADGKYQLLAPFRCALPPGQGPGVLSIRHDSSGSNHAAQR